jgi:hypothetical protein
MSLASVTSEPPCPACEGKPCVDGQVLLEYEQEIAGLKALRERVEALVADLERPYEPGLSPGNPKAMARRIREDVLLETPP